MIVHYSSSRGLTLQDAEDFRSFKIVLSCLSDRHPQVRELIFVDHDNALIGIDIIPTLPGAPTVPTWRADYGSMISTAAPFGWVDETSNLIRAHVERTSP
ncbi:hypothetical protein FHR70_001174 [Microvirga lupini]|uniref:Uncharacterized protein n=1 Tax=Microvirga lupini TaxID=420324 RepID=A0A7W4VJ34_9HYPH|nr:hypothetical protein [Microvirga lupini]MBB3018134.1 hypothetical protein [Microvirga lupini]